MAKGNEAGDGNKTAAQPPETEATAKEAKFTIERLRRDCMRLFKVTLSTFNGAMSGAAEQLTVREANERIEKWQGTLVFPAKKKEGK